MLIRLQYSCSTLAVLPGVGTVNTTTRLRRDAPFGLAVHGGKLLATLIGSVEYATRLMSMVMTLVFGDIRPGSLCSPIAYILNLRPDS